MTNLEQLHRLLGSVPELPISEFIESDEGVAESIQFLESPLAQEWLSQHPYWPKWHGVWWRLLTLSELGFQDRVPRAAVEALARSAQRAYEDGFFEAEISRRVGGLHRHARPCPCQLGNLCLILQCYGVDIDQYLPWARSWFIRYQMSDGGMSCAEKAYEATPHASSMVGMIAGLEALIDWKGGARSDDEIQFIERAAKLMIMRQLVRATDAPANPEEKLDELDWQQTAFPRFYFYDVQRGLKVLMKYLERFQGAIPAQALFPAVEAMVRRFPDGRVRVERRFFEDVDTWWTVGEWKRGGVELFPLLERVSQVGRVSPALTQEWHKIQRSLKEYLSEGRIY